MHNFKCQCIPYNVIWTKCIPRPSTLSENTLSYAKPLIKLVTHSNIGMFPFVYSLVSRTDTVSNANNRVYRHRTQGPSVKILENSALAYKYIF